MRETKSAGVGEEDDVEEKVDNEGEREYSARYETHKKREGEWGVTTVNDTVKQSPPRVTGSFTYPLKNSTIHWQISFRQSVL